MRLALLSGEEEEGMSRCFSTQESPWVACCDSGSVTQGVMSCWQCGALHLELDTRHVLGYSLQSTAVSQMAFVTYSQSLPSCFEKPLQLEGNSVEKKTARSIEVAMLEFSRLLMDSFMLGHFCRLF